MSKKKKPAPLPPPSELVSQLQHFPSSTSLSSIESSSQQEDYHKLLYFFSNFSNQNEVADFLKYKSKNMPGFFLLRPSFRDPRNLSVSVIVSDKSVRHVNIIIEKNGVQTKYYLVKEKQFNSLMQLMNYYRDHDVKNVQKVGHVRFSYAVERIKPRSVTDREDTTSISSGSSAQYTTPSCVSEFIPDQRPPLPKRPDNLPRKPSITSNSSIGSPDIPNRPPVAGALGSLNPNLGSQVSLVSSASGLSVFQDVSSRPPAPLPLGHQASDVNPYYSSPRNTEEDISDKLKEVLRESDLCDCGIPREMADLPSGWTVHRSKDPATYGRMFYQNYDGLTSWKLPEDIQRKLNATQKSNLKKLMYWQQGNMHGYLESTRTVTNTQQNGLNYQESLSSSVASFQTLDNTQF